MDMDIKWIGSVLGSVSSHFNVLEPFLLPSFYIHIPFFNLFSSFSILSFSFPCFLFPVRLFAFLFFCPFIELDSLSVATRTLPLQRGVHVVV